MKLFCQPKTYAIGLAVTYMLAAPSYDTTAKTNEPVGVGQACAADERESSELPGSCKPKFGWDCIHGTTHVFDKCDPTACT